MLGERLPPWSWLSSTCLQTGALIRWLLISLVSLILGFWHLAVSIVEGWSKAQTERFLLQRRLLLQHRNVIFNLPDIFIELILLGLKISLNSLLVVLMLLLFLILLRLPIFLGSAEHVQSHT